MNISIPVACQVTPKTNITFVGGGKVNAVMATSGFILGQCLLASRVPMGLLVKEDDGDSIPHAVDNEK